MEKIEITAKTEIESKRFYLPVKFEKNCPKCDSICGCNLDDENYLSHPSLNTKEEIGIYCPNCDDCFEVDVILRMQIEV